MGNVIKPVVEPLWAECPGLSRLIIVGYPAFGVSVAVLRLFTALPLGFLFSCSLRALLEDFGVWTLFLSPFYHHFTGAMSILMLFFELYMGMIYLPVRERELGSLAFAAWLLLAAAATNVVFLALMAALSAAFGGGGFYDAGNTGLWPLLILLMTHRLLGDPDGSSSFWGLAMIPNKWYPLAFLAFISLMSGRLLWNDAAAIAVGYAAWRYPWLSVDRLLPRRTLLDAAERRLCPQRRTCLGGSWLQPGGAAGGCGCGSAAPRGGGSGSGPAPSVWGATSSSFEVFSGRGNRLGGSEVPSAAPGGGACYEEPSPAPKEEKEGVALRGFQEV